MRHSALLLLLSLVFLGCFSTVGPRRVEPTGLYTHSFTQLEYPERIGVFRRQYVTEFDEDGADASGHYGTPITLAITATIYHYPATANLEAPTEDEFSVHAKQVIGDMARAAPGGRKVAIKAETHTVNSFELQGIHADYAFDSFSGYNSDVRTHLYLFAIDGWYLKFRFTYPADIHEGAIEYAGEMIRLIKWPIPPPAP